MNIALTAIILIIALLPGAVALRAYYTSIKEKASTIVIPFNEVLVRGIVISFFAHSIAICFVVRSLGDTVDFQLLYNILIGEKILTSNKEFTRSFLDFFIYNFALILIVFVTAKIFKFIAQKNNLDLNYHTLQNTNYWFQVFSGRYLEARNIKGDREKADLIYLDILSNKEILYSGFLVDFNYSPSKDMLENVILRSVLKRHLHKSSENNMKIVPGETSHIPGDVFVIPANTIENINIYYVNISESTNGKTTDALPTEDPIIISE